MSLFSELQRRNVLRVAIAYLAGAWLLIQIVETLFPIFGLSDAAIRLVVILLAIGFPLVLVLSWVYELTPEGLMLDRDVDRFASVTRHTAKKFDRTIIVVLALAVGYFAFDKFILDPAQDRKIAEQSRQEGAEQAREEARLAVWNEKSIAVLPFVNLGMRQEDEVLTNGIHDELLTRLVSIAALKVIARNSVMRYRNTEKSPSEIAEELSVATVLTGSVQWIGNQLRVNVQLVDARTENHLWADNYDRELTAENLFAIQSEITTEIAEALHAELSPAEASRIYALPTDNLDAYNSYMRGRQLMATRGTDELEHAVKEFEIATSLDPEFALAWVGLADAIRLLQQRGRAGTGAMEVRRNAVDTAIKLDDQLGEAYVAQSRNYWETERRQDAEAACNKAIELSPNYAAAYIQCGGLIGRKGMEFRGQRLVMYRKAGQLDPHSMPVQNMIGRVLTGLGRHDEALDQFNHMLRLDADFVPTYASIRELHEQKGDLALAIKWGRQALERDPDNGFYLSDLAILYFSLGDFESIDRIRTDMHARLEPGHWRLPWLEWNVFQAHGNMREMLDVIEKLPPPMADAWYINALKANTYFNLDDLTKAREYWLLSDPQWDDPGQWEALISTDETGMDRLHACKYASILITLGETAGGEELLRQAIHYSENVLPGLIEDSHVSPSLGWCYLAAGSYDNALDFYEQRIAHGHISNWWREKNLPWWSALRDDPRYIAMVDEIERKLNEQRELVRQMDETGPMEQVL